MRRSEIVRRDRADRRRRQIVVEADQILSGIGLISNAGARFDAPETISAQWRFEDVLRGRYDPEQHLEDMEDPGGDPGRGAGRQTGQACPDRDPGIAGGNTARVYNFDVAKLTGPA